MNQEDVDREVALFYREKKLRKNIKFPVSFGSNIEFDGIQMGTGDPKHKKKSVVTVKFLKKKNHGRK